MEISRYRARCPAGRVPRKRWHDHVSNDSECSLVPSTLCSGMCCVVLETKLSLDAMEGENFLRRVRSCTGQPWTM